MQATGTSKSSFVGKMAGKLGSLMGSKTDSHPIARTPKEVIDNLRRDRDAAYKKQGSEQYEMARELASSSEGEVSLVKAKSSGKLYVVKHTLTEHRLPEDWKLPKDDAEYHYPNEARIVQDTLGPHPNLINIYEVTEDRDKSGRFKLWMEFASAGDLYAQLDYWFVKRRSPVPETFLLHLIVEMVQALAFIHHGLRYAGNGKWTQDESFKSVIHGDIKPDNIFLRWGTDPKGGLPEVVLGDFGVARVAGDNRVKKMPGTDIFHAPEDRKILGDAEFSKDTIDLYLTVGDHRTVAADMYSFGQILYMMASKEINPREIGKDPSDIRVSRDFDTPEIRELIVRCLAVDPAKRAEASFRDAVGILPLVEKIRKVRDERVQKLYPLDPLEWKCPPPKPTSRS